MISKVAKQLINKNALVKAQVRSMGGGPKKPNMPATETNFDVVVVGKYLYQAILIGVCL